MFLLYRRKICRFFGDFSKIEKRNRVYSLLLSVDSFNLCYWCSGVEKRPNNKVPMNWWNKLEKKTLLKNEHENFCSPIRGGRILQKFHNFVLKGASFRTQGGKRKFSLTILTVKNENWLLGLCSGPIESSSSNSLETQFYITSHSPNRILMTHSTSPIISLQANDIEFSS